MLQTSGYRTNKIRRADGELQTERPQIRCLEQRVFRIAQKQGGDVQTTVSEGADKFEASPAGKPQIAEQKIDASALKLPDCPTQMRSPNYRRPQIVETPENLRLLGSEAWGRQEKPRPEAGLLGTHNRQNS